MTENTQQAQTPAAPAVAAPATPAVAAPAQAPAVANAPVSGDGLTPEGKAAANILAMAAADPEFAKIPEVKKLVEMSKQAPAKPADASVDKPNAETKPADQSTDADDDGAEERKSVLFSRKAPKPTVEFKTTEDYSKYIEQKFGVKDPAAFMSSAEKWRADSQELTETTNKVTGYEQVFEKMPDALYDAIQEWGKGGDWMEAVRTKLPSMDFSKPFEKQVSKIMNQYFPGKFTEEQLDSDDVVVKNAIDVARSRFDLEKSKVESKRGEAMERAEKIAASLRESANTSVLKLEETFPDMDHRRKSEIKKMLVSDELESLFKKPDGTWKPEAAKMLALALHGEAELTTRVTKATEKAASKARTEATMDVVARGADEPTKSKGLQDQKPTLPAEVAKALEGVNRKSFY